MEDNFGRWSARENIKNLPEVDEGEQGQPGY
jgi:hypothetical protein